MVPVRIVRISISLVVPQQDSKFRVFVSRFLGRRHTHTLAPRSVVSWNGSRTLRFLPESLPNHFPNPTQPNHHTTAAALHLRRRGIQFQNQPKQPFFLVSTPLRRTRENDSPHLLWQVSIRVEEKPRRVGRSLETTTRGSEKSCVVVSTSQPANQPTSQRHSFPLKQATNKRPSEAADHPRSFPA